MDRPGADAGHHQRLFTGDSTRGEKGHRIQHLLPPQPQAKQQQNLEQQLEQAEEKEQCGWYQQLSSLGRVFVPALPGHWHTDADFGSGESDLFAVGRSGGAEGGGEYPVNQHDHQRSTRLGSSGWACDYTSIITWIGPCFWWIFSCIMFITIMTFRYIIGVFPSKGYINISWKAQRCKCASSMPYADMRYTWNTSILLAIPPFSHLLQNTKHPTHNT